MKSNILTVIIVMLCALFLGLIMGVAIVNKHWERESIRQGNAYYDPQTGIFTWNSEG